MPVASITAQNPLASQKIRRTQQKIKTAQKRKIDLRGRNTAASPSMLSKGGFKTSNYTLHGTPRNRKFSILQQRTSILGPLSKDSQPTTLP
eukprot:12777019-Ditylum_brightwellii.AAC.1